MSLEDVIAHTSQTAEGVKSAPAVLALGRRNGVDLPITEAVCACWPENCRLTNSPDCCCLGNVSTKAHRPESDHDSGHPLEN